MIPLKTQKYSSPGNVGGRAGENVKLILKEIEKGERKTEGKGMKLKLKITINTW